MTLDQLPPLGNPDTDFLTGPQSPEVLATQHTALRVVPAVGEYGAEHPDTYAGLFLSTGHVYVGFTRDAEEHLAALRQRVDDPEVLRAFRAKYTYRELDKVKQQLSSEMRPPSEEGIPISGVAVDEYHNRVSVWLFRRDTSEEAKLTDRHGDMFIFEAKYVRLGGRMRSDPT